MNYEQVMNQWLASGPVLEGTIRIWKEQESLVIDGRLIRPRRLWAWESRQTPFGDRYTAEVNVVCPEQFEHHELGLLGCLACTVFEPLEAILASAESGHGGFR